MTRPGWWLLSFLALALEPDERDAVLGDVAESGKSGYVAIPDLLGLIVRRQAGLWMIWHPWVALVGVSALAGVPLSQISFRFNVDIGEQLIAYQRHGVHYGTGLTAGQDIAFLSCIAAALLVWSWTCGFALGSLSGRTVWLTWLVFYLIVLDSTWLRFVLSGNIILRDPQPFRLLLNGSLPLSPAALLFFPAALLGTFMGARRDFLPARGASLLASVIITLAVLATWMSGWYETAHEVWSGGAWIATAWPTRLLPFLLVSWPAARLFSPRRKIMA
jgi:hypothetical protein